MVAASVLSQAAGRDPGNFELKGEKWVDSTDLRGLGMDCIAGLRMFVNATHVWKEDLTSWPSQRDGFAHGGALLSSVHASEQTTSASKIAEENKEMRAAFSFRDDYIHFDAHDDGFGLLWDALKDKGVDHQNEDAINCKKLLAKSFRCSLDS